MKLQKINRNTESARFEIIEEYRASLPSTSERRFLSKADSTAYAYGILEMRKAESAFKQLSDNSHFEQGSRLVKLSSLSYLTAAQA